MNGCDLVVGTPACMLRLRERGGDTFLQLKRVCHLVLDDADLLVESFTAQVSHSPDDTGRNSGSCEAPPPCLVPILPTAVCCEKARPVTSSSLNKSRLSLVNVDMTPMTRIRGGYCRTDLGCV